MSECMGGGGCLWLMPMHLLSVRDGIPLIVDAHGPVGLELANHCRQPKTVNCGKKRISADMASVGVPRDLCNTVIAIDPVQRRWRCLPLGVTWGPPHLPFVL